MHLFSSSSKFAFVFNLSSGNKTKRCRSILCRRINGFSAGDRGRFPKSDVQQSRSSRFEGYFRQPLSYGCDTGEKLKLLPCEIYGSLLSSSVRETSYTVCLTVPRYILFKKNSQQMLVKIEMESIINTDEHKIWWS